MTPSKRREALKQHRLSIERGDTHPKKNTNKTVFTLENMPGAHWLVGAPLILTGLYKKGRENAKKIVKREMTIEFTDLPTSFDGYRVLHLSDLHLDCDERILEQLLLTLHGIEFHICVLTGDYRFKFGGDHHPALNDTLQLVCHLKKISPHILAVLGNHDSLTIGEGLEKAGVDVLLNRSKVIQTKAEEIWIAGVDDPHYYACHDVGLALEEVPFDAFKIFLAHSPALYREASDAGVHLYLCGHTHGGQIRLPGIGALVKNTPAPRRYIDGLWKHNEMVGLTHRGVGSSLLPIRFACPPEVWVIELRRKNK